MTKRFNSRPRFVVRSSQKLQKKEEKVVSLKRMVELTNKIALE